MAKKNKLVIVVPSYNEEEVLPTTIPALVDVLETLISSNTVAKSSRLLFVNDGSKDQTWKWIEEAHQKNERVTGVNFSRNFGHQNAVLAGLEIASQDADMVISIDADLQDDITVIPDMVDKFLEGYDVVYGVRDNRDTDTAFKRQTAGLFYHLMSQLGTQLVPNHADFRLMSRRAILALKDFPERNLFLRGLVPMVGFSNTKVFYARKDRTAGISKYPLGKMLGFAWNGITSFSLAPLRLMLVMGVISLIVGISVMGYALSRNFGGQTTTGWTSIVVSIWFVAGIQLISLSIIGEYIGKIFIESKKRPRYIIQDDLYTSVSKRDN